METPFTMMDTDINKGKVEPIVVDQEPSEKPPRPSIIELKNGKVIFKQKSISLEKLSETMQEIVKFREMLEERRLSQAGPLDAIPEEHKPLIVKLVHESDKAIGPLCRHLLHLLLPSPDEDSQTFISSSPSIIPTIALESAIKSVATRTNYGLDSPSEGTKLPAALCVWRWEVKEEFRDYLPKGAKEKAEVRLNERIQAKKDLLAAFHALPKHEQDSIINPKGSSKPSQKEKEKTHKYTQSTADAAQPDAKDASPKKEKKVDGEDNDENGSREEGSSDKKSTPRPKKAVDSEQAAKEKERLEKKAAKAEKEKKQKEAQDKSRSLMANFFGKPKGAATNAASSSSRPSPSVKVLGDGKGKGSPASPGPPEHPISDFDRTFRPFALKKGAELAPINWFVEDARKRREGKGKKKMVPGEVIVIDSDDPVEVKTEEGDVDMKEPDETRDIGQMSTHERLSSILASLPPSTNPSLRFRPLRPHLRTHSTHSIPELLTRLTEAEVTGNVPLVRHLLSILSSRTLIPYKALCFHENTRPGYFGTFTKTSKEVGGRRPFGKDVGVIDYGYDSGEEWVEEGEGEADDVAEGSDEEEGAGAGADEVDSDVDSWLVDDDEIEEVGTPIEDRAESPGFLPPALSLLVEKEREMEMEKRKKRKAAAERGDGSQGKKRKVVVPLVPFIKGPCWDTTIGKCEYEPFEGYKIQVFNDTPYPINPFTFVSSCPITTKPSTSTDAQFLVPPLPAHVQQSASVALASTATENTSSAPKRPPPPPKTAFPDAHLPTLLSNIRKLSTSNLTVLVESIRTALQEQGVKVKKNAIEAKVKEVGEKCKVKKVWVVRGEGQLGVQVSQP
ncbi:hypothetical protein JAAARDRAFT_68081 [Jaapia argillacea MUCL 33604]|uniref:Chromatin assembly factor 1 subunit A dimerization domain-containing protein n=1 Tax=Jaapia argillacea MUCL 33604 TaxID=933084 RepID=A0A067PXB3_9AGAM|nr:hypothetical protein JAAARDRAFT_68081 [Jaapia argillacea MUCL 33604]